MNNEFIHDLGSTHQNNAIIQPSNDESKHSIESLSDSEPFDREFPLQINHTTEDEMHENDRKDQDLSEGAYIKNSTIIINNSNKIYSKRFRQICWRLPEQFETSFQLLENQLFRLIDIVRIKYTYFYFITYKLSFSYQKIYKRFYMKTAMIRNL